MDKAKPFEISKPVVYEAWKKVKANQGSAGIDNQTIEDFEKNLKDNLYKIWNRMSSGSYFPKAVKTVEIPKKDGGQRALGIPTISSAAEVTHLQQTNEKLLGSNEKLLEEIDKLTQLLAISQKSIQQLTEQNQYLLEDSRKKSPWWKRIFRRRN